MSFNEQEEGSKLFPCLLEWINLERKQLGIQGCLFTLDQSIQQEILTKILKTIDQPTFQEFQIMRNSSKLDIIEKYLNRQFGKRMKWSFKQIFTNLNQLKNYRQFAQLVCYFSIHSKKKNEFINRILTLSEQNQNNLMVSMQNIESNLQNIIQVKEILQQVQYLQYQNDQLKKRLQQMGKANKQLLQILNQYEAESKKDKLEIKKLMNQKIEVFSTLKIDSISQYIEVYNRLKHENERNLQVIKSLQTKLQLSQINNKQLNERIKCDCLVINNLSEQISRLKQIINEGSCKYQYGEYLKSSVSKQNLLKSIGGKSNNKENQNISKSSTRVQKSMQIPADWISLLQNQDSILDRSRIRSYNYQLMGKLENIHSKYNCLNDELITLRQKNKILKGKNRTYKQTVKLVQENYKQFQFKYQASAKQTNKMFYGKVKKRGT